MKRLNQNGAIDFMFIITLIVVAAVGYFVYTQVAATDEVVQDTAVDTEASSNSSVESDSSEEVALSESWTKFESANFTVGIPDGWEVIANNSIALSDQTELDYVEGEPAVIDVKEFGTDSQYTFSIAVNDEPLSTQDALVCEDVSVNNFEGQRCTAEVPEDYIIQGLGDLIPGTTVLFYQLNVDGEYVAVQYQAQTADTTSLATTLIEEVVNSIRVN